MRHLLGAEPFGPRRKKGWDGLYEWEAEYLAAEMVKKRETGTHKQSQVTNLVRLARA